MTSESPRDRYVLVLAGGRGERFWPWSRPDRPKQLLPLARGGRTLLAATLDRACALVPPDHVVVLTAASIKAAVERDAAGRGVVVLGEPMMRNTAAAIGAAGAWFAAQGGDPAFAVLPADHAIDDEGAFVADLEQAFGLAEREAVLITFGIPPTSPDTNFGYIRAGEALGERVNRVAQFTEKPDRETAISYLERGGYAWNAGIFVWRASVFFDALKASRPALAAPLVALAGVADPAAFERRLADVFPGLESISVDYAVLEHAPNTVVREASFDWDDLGSWGAWARRQPRDARDNVTFGEAVVIDCEGCVVVGESGTAAAMGLRGMVVVHVEGATLCCRLEDSAQVRRVNEAVQARTR